MLSFIFTGYLQISTVYAFFKNTGIDLSFNWQETG